MKSNILKVVIALVFLVMFNILFFLLGGTEQSDVNWVCYGFIHAAYICLLITPLFCNSGKGLTVLSASLYLRALFYFFTELTVGLLFIAIAPQSITWPLIIQSVLLAVFIILQLMSVLANDATHASIQKQKAESQFIRTLAEQVRSRMREIEDQDLRKEVERSYDALNNSPIESIPEALNVELALRNAVDMLCAAIEDTDKEQIIKKAKRVRNAVQDRNAVIRRCRMS